MPGATNLNHPPRVANSDRAIVTRVQQCTPEQDEAQVTGTGLPRDYASRLQQLLHAQWQAGESYEKFAQRLGFSSGRTLKAWLALDFKIEPDARKLRQFARYLGWQYWELMRYLDTGQAPEPSQNRAKAIAPVSPPPVVAPPPSLAANAALRGTVQQLRSLVDTLQQWLELLPSSPPQVSQPREATKLSNDLATAPRDRASIRQPRPQFRPRR
ncbi:MAG: hypothetical protein HC838_03580 [Spirulinaceae cyanobacterium RM2_2_10]|nr:hypothetical protein [Spirulinaceae cyanobacterium RM2_2_10]